MKPEIVVRRISIPLFLCFYFSSSLLITQSRVGREASRVLQFVQALQSGEPLFKDSSKSLPDNRPRFREAKKVAIDFDFRPTPEVHLKPRVQNFRFAQFTLYWEAHHFPASPATRAPPSLV